MINYRRHTELTATILDRHFPSKIRLKLFLTDLTTVFLDYPKHVLFWRARLTNNKCWGLSFQNLIRLRRLYFMNWFPYFLALVNFHNNSWQLPSSANLHLIGWVSLASLVVNPTVQSSCRHAEGIEIWSEGVWATAQNSATFPVKMIFFHWIILDTWEILRGRVSSPTV